MQAIVVFIKLWLEGAYSTLNRYFTFDVNLAEVFQLPQLHKTLLSVSLEQFPQGKLMLYKTWKALKY
jgi:hypothetical protein